MYLITRLVSNLSNITEEVEQTKRTIKKVNLFPLIFKNSNMQQYSNLIEAIDGLRMEGYVEDFNLQQHCLECRDRQYQIFHDEFVVDKYFRFDVSSDAADQSIIYAISSEKYELKGILINAYGIYTEPVTNEMLSKLMIAE
jgi:hypothetical protein